MKGKIIVAIFLAAFLINAMLPGAMARPDTGEFQERRIQKMGMGNDGDMRKVSENVETVSKINDHLKKCYNYIKSNKFSDTPLKTCERILEGEIKCVEFLKSLNVKKPLAKCDELLNKTRKIVERTAEKVKEVKEKKERIVERTERTIRKMRSYVAERVTKELEEWKLKRFDDIVERNPAAKTVLQALDENKIKILSMLPKVEQERIIEKGTDEAVRILSQYRIVKVEKDMMYKKREITRERLMKARERYEKAKKEYMRVNKLYKEKKNKFIEAKNRLRECKGKETPECQQLREETREYARNFLRHAISVMLQHLEKIKASIEASDSIEEEKVQEMLSDIDETVVSLKRIYDEVEKAENKDDIKRAAREVEKIWKEIRNRERMHVAKLIHSKVWKLIKRGERIEDRLYATVERMQKRGMDTSRIENSIDKYSSAVVAAKEAYKKASELLQEANNLRRDNESSNETRNIIREKIKEAKSYIKEANSRMREAYNILKDIIKEIKKLKADLVREDELKDEKVEIIEEHGKMSPQNRTNMTGSTSMNEIEKDENTDTWENETSNISNPTS